MRNPVGSTMVPWPAPRPRRRRDLRRSSRASASVSLAGGVRWRAGPLCQSLFLLCLNQSLSWFCKNHISSSSDPKIVKQISCCFLRWLVFNKNIKWIMFSGKLFIKDLILLFMDKCISLVILLSLLWKFYGSLCMALGCSDNYFMIFEALQWWYVICVWNMAYFFN